MNTHSRASERGGARLKFLIVIAILLVIGYAGYVFVPVSYESYQLKDLMQHNVDLAVATGKPASWIKDQLVKSSAEYGIPEDAVITPQEQDGRLEVRVQYVKPLAFPGFIYNYEFDHTAKSSNFLTVK